MSNNDINLGWKNYYHGAVQSLPTYQDTINVFDEVGVDELTHELITLISALTSNENTTSPILFSQTDEIGFNGEFQPNYLCKSVVDCIEICSQKFALFLSATNEDSFELSLHISNYLSDKNVVQWPIVEEISSLELLRKVHIKIPKPILNKKNSLGIFYQEADFLSSDVLINHKLLDLTKGNESHYFRLYWSSKQKKVTAYFAVGEPFLR